VRSAEDSDPRAAPADSGRAGVSTRKATRFGPWSVLALSGLLGFLTGALRFPTWQVAVEASQVVAGLVQYPADNPFYQYQLKLWTMLHQVSAVLLRAGVSEIALSQLISGLLGMVSFQALALLVYAFSKDTLLAILSPALIFYTRAAEHGAVYPIALMGTDHTYGVLGLSTALLVVAMLGTRLYRAGLFLLGLAPAVHPSIGGWLLLIVAACAWWDFRSMRAELRPALPYLAAGFAVTAFSLVIQLAMGWNLPGVDADIASRYLSAFVTAWDDHRRPAAVVSVGTILNLDLLVIACLWLYRFAADLSRAELFVLRVFAVSAILSLALLFVSWLPPDTLPAALLTLMPSRFLNFDVLAFVPVILGLLGRYRNRPWGRLAIAFFMIALFVSYRSMVWDGRPVAQRFDEYLRLNPWHVFVAASLVLPAIRMAPASTDERLSRMVRPVAALSVLVLIVSTALTWRRPAPYPLLDRTNDPFWADVARETRGLLLTGGSFHLVQLYTRRPVLLDGGALDFLTYAPGGAPAVDRILREVYGIDFFNPPDDARRTAAIPHRFNKPVWEGYPRVKWEEIGWTFGVSHVLTRADWTLDLPIATQNRFWKLYRIGE
jgi:hypothetical protein